MTNVLLPINRLLGYILLAVFGLFTTNTHSADIDYNRDIRPILSDNCWACHGPDEKERKAGLRLDVPEQAFAALESGGHALVPGQPEKSQLLERIQAQDPDDLMPPPKSGKKLDSKQIALIQTWIEQGAEFKNHWAFIKPNRPDLPTVREESWPYNEIDTFILAKLESEGLSPSPEASKETLIRRLTLDLTGLPPTLEEIDAFLADKTPDAYERLVNRLFESQHYGERMAEHWLDLARYADTHGYHLDSGRDMWKWREWVIEAFNENMPYSQFTVDQLAGDLLPNPSKDQILATGFNRNSMINFEGGAIAQEYLTQYIKDRVVTTSTVYLGLTMGCAECHDHKFDPLSMKDFYRFYAYFNAVPERGLDGSRGNAAPVLALPTPEQEEEMARLQNEKRKIELSLAKAEPDIEKARNQWEDELLSRASGQSFTSLQPISMESSQGSSFELLEDHSILVSGINPETDKYTIRAPIEGSGWTVLKLEALTHPSLPGEGPGRYSNASFVLDELRAGIRTPKPDSELHRIAFKHAHSDYNQKGFAVEGLIDGKAGTGWAIDAPVRHQNGFAILVASEPFGSEGSSVIEIEMDFGGAYKQHGLGRFRLSLTQNPLDALPKEIREVLLVARDKRSEPQSKALAMFYRDSISPLSQDFENQIRELDKKIAALKNEFPTSMVMAQMDKPRDTHILIRGQYDQPGEEVFPGPPAEVMPALADLPPNRLGLAQWLVDPDHPLVARVTVNRFWQMIMGTGIVKTANDFGSQGEYPVHPELLDWLAREFVDKGWDVKHILRKIVLSATYRQSPVVSRDLVERDPENRLLARGPRFRLSAEQIRDNALAISGLLVRKLGGPSVSPYQPPGLWQELSSRKDSGNWTAQIFKQSHGEDLYRRSIYTFWKRTCPPPSLITFDAPDRETCVVYRERTSTPLQALVLMNDPTYMEASRVLAEAMILRGGSSAEEKISFAFRKATARKPVPKEIDLLKQLYVEQWERFGLQPEEAEKIMQSGEYPRNPALSVRETAAWAMVASTILNLDETINKG